MTLKYRQASYTCFIGFRRDTMRSGKHLASTLNMRLFFGLKPEPKIALEIATWRDKALPPMRHSVHVDNLHITLAFLGEIHESQLETLMSSAAQVAASPFEISMNQMGYWRKPDLLWIAAERIPDAIIALAKELGSLSVSMGSRREKRAYFPHITIVRNCRVPPPINIIKPVFTLCFSHYSLFESINTRSGVRYRQLQDWQLGTGSTWL